jgi:hypothetical protein
VLCVSMCCRAFSDRGPSCWIWGLSCGFYSFRFEFTSSSLEVAPSWFLNSKAFMLFAYCLQTCELYCCQHSWASPPSLANPGN